jgi:hypothetical protein
VKGYVVRTSLHDTGTPYAKIIEVFRSLVKRILTNTRAELDYLLYVVRVNRRSLIEVVCGAHTLFELRGNFQRTVYFHLFYRVIKFLYIRIGVLWTRCIGYLGTCTALYSCTDKISLTSVESSSCRQSQNTAENKYDTSKN